MFVEKCKSSNDLWKTNERGIRFNTTRHALIMALFARDHMLVKSSPKAEGEVEVGLVFSIEGEKTECVQRRYPSPLHCFLVWFWCLLQCSLF